MSSYKLYYFNIKVLGEPLRMIFRLAGVPFEDIRIERSTWPEHKQKLGWGKMPILKFEDKELCQSSAIAAYLGKKYNLVGNNEMDLAKCLEYIGVANDCRQGWRTYWFEPDSKKQDELKKGLMEVDFPNYLGKFSKILADNNGKWLVGNTVTIADLFLVVFLELFEETVDNKLLESYPAMKAYKENIYAIPQIKEWIETRPKTQF